MAKSWVVPLSTRRAGTDDDKELIGAEQFNALLENPELPWYEELTVGVGDSRYSKPAYLHLVHIDGYRLISADLRDPEHPWRHKPQEMGRALFQLLDSPAS